MEPEFATFQTFNDPTLADALVEVLEKHEINYHLQQVTTSANPLMALNNELDKEYIIKISPEDFTRANQILAEEQSVDLDAVESDHYLFAFSNDELLDLLAKREEWSAYDYQLAQKILSDRGVELSAEKLSQMEQERISELKQPEPPQTTWIILGYICAVLGGLFGLLIGWHLMGHKRTLPNGETVYAYTNKDREHGRVIFYLAIVGFIAAVAMQLLRA
ncbi:hypothetical protein [Mucilaginibacter psychrotolerans]|uniref:DUF2007 domain-containing protein n=1 Tax=Mucilaginibacter psychrotolerans TaxID=1524096 RepID=A0A4Y8SMD1_9SPHI|nr:hypothetical protein [Mucilaginibacter psychrotolerans]TFF40108.1 hypothetical protein E2R66_02320 [Mucilaginibacter psychrotolerans]